VPEPDPVTDPPPVVVVPLWVGGVLPAGAVSSLTPDDVLDVSDGLTVGDDDALGGLMVVWAGLFVLLAEPADVPVGGVAGGVLGQPVAVPVTFVFALAELVAVALPVGVALTVTDAVTVGVTLGVTVGLGLSVGLIGGVVVTVLGLAGGLVVVVVRDGLTFGEALGKALGAALGAGDGGHDAPGNGVVPPADVPVPLRLPPDDPPPGDGREVDVPDEWAVPVTADSTSWKNAGRSGGTAASTTPTANTVTPMARAGRSMTSLQFLGRRGACRADPGRADPGRADAARRPAPAWRQYPPSCAKNPAIASRMAAILGWLA